MIKDDPFYFATPYEADAFHVFLAAQNIPKKRLAINAPEKCDLETIESAIAKFEKLHNIALKEENETPLICQKCEGKGSAFKKSWFKTRKVHCSDCNGKGILLKK